MSLHDIFIAFKKHLHETVPTEITQGLLLSKYHAKVLVNDFGTAYRIDGIDWDRKDNPEVNNLYVWLTLNADFMDYLIVAVDHKKPESRYGDSGGWLDNSWKARRVIRAVLEVDGDKDSK